MTIEQTKSHFKRIAQKSNQILLTVLGNSKTDCQASEIQLKLNLDGHAIMDECDQSTRADSKMDNLTNNSASYVNFSQLLDQSYEKESTPAQTKKRYYRVVYYKGKNQQENIPKEETMAPQRQKSNRRRRRLIQDCERLPNPNKKFIDNNKLVRTKQIINHNDHFFKKANNICEESRINETLAQPSNSANMRERFEHVMRNKENSILPAKLMIAQRQTPIEYIEQMDDILDHDAPQPGQYSLNYKRKDLLSMSEQQIKHVPNLTIQNEFACLQFRETVSLYRKDIEKSIHIENKGLRIDDQDWKHKMFQTTLYNFDRYASKTVIDKIAAKQCIFNSNSLNRLKILNFDERSGDLTLMQSEKMRQEQYQL